MTSVDVKIWIWQLILTGVFATTKLHKLGLKTLLISSSY